MKIELNDFAAIAIVMTAMCAVIIYGMHLGLIK